LKTATGTDKDSIKGITHQKIYLTTTRGKIVHTCINLIISEKLNELDLILGADFLFMNGYVSRSEYGRKRKPIMTVWTARS